MALLRNPTLPTYSGAPVSTDKRKQSLYFPDDMLKEIQDEAKRLDRSYSWVVQKAWEVARARIAQLPSAPGTSTPSTNQ